MNRIIKCFAQGDQSGWEGLCLDFDLSVQGDSLEEVKEGLLQAVDDYLKYVASLPIEEQAKFLKRKAPFSVRLSFQAKFIFAILFPGSKDDGPSGRAEFSVPCHA